MITFDPNLRPPLWDSLDDAKAQMEYGFERCDVLKISDNEIQFVSGMEDYDDGINIFRKISDSIDFPDNGKRGKPCLL